MSKSKCKSMCTVDVNRTPFMPEHEIVLIQTHQKCCYYSEKEKQKCKKTSTFKMESRMCDTSRLNLLSDFKKYFGMKFN